MQVVTSRDQYGNPTGYADDGRPDPNSAAANQQLQSATQAARDAQAAFEAGHISAQQLDQINAQVDSALKNYTTVTGRQNQQQGPLATVSGSTGASYYGGPYRIPQELLAQWRQNGGTEKPTTVPAGTNGTPFLNYGTPNAGGAAPQFYGGPYHIPPELLAQWGVPPGGNPAAPRAGGGWQPGQTPTGGGMQTGGGEPRPSLGMVAGVDPRPANGPGSQGYYKHPSSPSQFNLPVLMKDGSTRVFTAIDSDLDAALKDGGRPVDIYGQPMTVTSNVYGGYLVTDSKGQPMGLNVAGGGDWLPGEQEALSNYMGAGWKPGAPPIANPPALPPAAQQSSGGGSTAGGSPFDFGWLTQKFSEQPQFQAPTNEDLQNDPGYQSTLAEAQKALERKASAGGYLLTPRAGKEMTRFSEDYAAAKYGDLYNRKAAEFDRNRDIFRTDRNDVFGKLTTVAGLGQNAATQTGRFGVDFGNTAGNNINATGETAANARIAQGNAWQSAAQSIGNNGVDIYGRRRYGLSSVAA